MPTDPEQSTLLGYLAALLFGGGGAAKLVTHEGRIKALETRQAKHADKIEAVHGTVARLDERSVRAEEDRQRILEKLDAVASAVDRNASLYVARRKQYIKDTGREPED